MQLQEVEGAQVDSSRLKLKVDRCALPAGPMVPMVPMVPFCKRQLEAACKPAG